MKYSNNVIKTIVALVAILLGILIINNVFMDRESQSMQVEDEYFTYQDHMRESFNTLSNSEKEVIVENEYFSTCNEVMDFCNIENNQALAGCEYCLGR